MKKLKQDGNRYAALALSGLLLSSFVAPPLTALGGGDGGPLREREIKLLANLEGRTAKMISLDQTGAKLAYVYDPGDGRVFVIEDGRESKAYKDIRQIVLSPDGTRLCVVSMQEGKLLVECDGKEIGRYEKVFPDPLFSRDSRKLAFIAAAGDREFVVVGGKEGDKYDEVGQAVFSGKGEHFAYVARRGGDHFIVFDNERWGIDGVPGGLAFSPDGQHFAYVVRDQRRARVIVDGRAEPWYDDVGSGLLSFSPDSRRFCYFARQFQQGGQPGDTTPEDWFMVCDGKKGPPCGSPGRATFSPDSRHLAYGTLHGGRPVIVLDGEPLPAVARAAGVELLKYAPDGKHLVYSALRLQRDNAVLKGRRSIVVNEMQGKEYGLIWLPVFSPDGRHLAYCAKDEDEEWLVIDGVEGPKHKQVRVPRDYRSAATVVRYVAIDQNRVSLVEVDWPKDLDRSNGLKPVLSVPEHQSGRTDAR